MTWLREINVRGPQGPGGTIDAQSIRDEGVIVGMPTKDTQSSSRTSLPIAWTNRVMDDPWTDTYLDIEEGAWTNGWRYSKNVPFLSDTTGRLPTSLLSEQVALKSDIPDISDIEAIVESIPRVEMRIRPELTIFGARVAAAAASSQPVAMCIASSSTFARNPGPGVRLLGFIQSTYRVANQSAMQFSADADFTRRTTPGIHAYNAGQGGTRSDTYLTDEESDKLAALGPAMILHVVGANDYTNQVDPAVYQANIENRIDYLDSKMSLPCQHILVHAYARLAYTPPTYPNSAYGDALQAIADDRANCAFIDYSLPFEAVGVPGGDPFDLIDTDNLHPTARGNRFIADIVSAGIVI